MYAFNEQQTPERIVQTMVRMHIEEGVKDIVRLIKGITENARLGKIIFRSGRYDCLP